MPIGKLSFQSASECLDLLVLLRMKRDILRKMYKEIEADDALLDWNTKGEILADIALTGVDYNWMMETILQTMTLHSYPFEIIDRR